jgi:hypothetical protein
LLWRQATTQALRCVKPGRRHLYEGAIGQLYLSSAANARRATRGWNFPNIDSLLAHPSMACDAAVLAALLARCGPKLLVVQFAMPPGGASSGAGPAAPASAGAPGGHRDVRQYSVDARVLQLLAERAGLGALVSTAATIPGSALAHVRTAVAAPFAHLTACGVRIAAADAPALLALLAAGRLRTLGLLIDVVGATPATRLAVVAAIAACAPRLRALRIHYTPMREPYHLAFPFIAMAAGGLGYWAPAGAGADDVIADDFCELRHLHELEALTVQGALFFMDDAGWRALLGGMPRLQRLTVGRFCTIPRDALVTAGAACRQLCHVEFYSCVDFSVALDREGAALAARRPPGWVMLPELRSVHVMVEAYSEAEYVYTL